MATTLVGLATTTLASNATTVTFSSIPGTYRDLRLVFSHANSGTATGSDGFIRINNDSGANYSDVFMHGNGSVTASGSRTAQTTIQWYVDSTSLGATFMTFDFMDYSATDKHKTVLSRQDQSSYLTMAYAARWAGTAAITSISLTAADNLGSGTPDQFIAGSTFSLYGVTS